MESYSILPKVNYVRWPSHKYAVEFVKIDGFQTVMVMRTGTYSYHLTILDNFLLSFFSVNTETNENDIPRLSWALLYGLVAYVLVLLALCSIHQ